MLPQFHPRCLTSHLIAGLVASYLVFLGILLTHTEGRDFDASAPSTLRCVVWDQSFCPTASGQRLR
jgi:hypothetical protein